MKIFLSWSRPRSRAVAEALNDWLKRVIQAVKPFYSPDIEKGAKWSNELDGALEGTRFGIICLTPDNLNSTWVHYEAGALSKTPDALIWTFLHGINHGDVPQPLGKFQHTLAEKEDVFKLLKSINKRLADVGGEPLDITVLNENFEMYWPKLEEKLKAAEDIGDSVEKPREEREILLEILDIVRNQQRTDRNMPDLAFDSSSRARSMETYQSIDIPPGVNISPEIAKRVRDEIMADYPSVNVSFIKVNDKAMINIYCAQWSSSSDLPKILGRIQEMIGISGLYARAIISRRTEAAYLNNPQSA